MQCFWLLKQPSILRRTGQYNQFNVSMSKAMLSVPQVFYLQHDLITVDVVIINYFPESYPINDKNVSLANPKINRYCSLTTCTCKAPINTNLFLLCHGAIC